tara:strand:+ start:354 stop:509 length:156 start_codon:yes stop_codon:yes gene_type:complete
MNFLAQVSGASDYMSTSFLNDIVSWGVGIVVLILSLGFWFMWWYLGKQSKS